MTDREILHASRRWRTDWRSLTAAALCVLVVGIAFLFVPHLADAASFTWTRVRGPGTINFHEPAVTNSSVVPLTELSASQSVLIVNNTDQILCIEQSTSATCAAVTMNCAGTSAGTDNDVLTVDAGVSVSLPKPPATTLCGKLAGAIGNSRQVRTAEAN